jgi:folate-binding protein YgfZ
MDLLGELGAVVVARDVVHVTGPDATTYLQGQLSADLDAIGDGASAWSLLLEPTGRMGALVRVARLGEAWQLDVDADFGDAVRERLARFLLRVQVELVLERQPMVAVRGPGAERVGVPAGAVALAPCWPAVEGVDLLGGDGILPAGVPEATSEDLETARVAAGVPAMGAEITRDTIPGELGALWIEATVSFDKGCYTGQELVARIDSRGGNVPHPLRALAGADPLAPGGVVLLDGDEVGHVTSAAVHPTLGAIALAVLARRVEAGTQGVRATGPNGLVPVDVVDIPLIA